jgi:RNA polymerase sigma-70 factor (ECF subfamily)
MAGAERRVIEQTLTMSRATAREDEYGRIVREHGPAIRRLASSYERDPAKREDLEQEIGVAIWQALPAFRGDCSVRTFVFRIAHNRAVTHIQRQRRYAADSLPDDAPVYDLGASPEAAVAEQQHHQRLHHAIQQLPLPMRQVVVLMLEEFSHREIADVMGISEANVAVRLTRARAALRALLTTEETR